MRQLIYIPEFVFQSVSMLILTRDPELVLYSILIRVQWSLSIEDTIWTQLAVLYIEVSLVQR